MSDANGSNEINEIWPHGLPGWKDYKCELVVSEYWDKNLEVERFLIGALNFERRADALLLLEGWKRLSKDDFARLLSHARGGKNLRFEIFQSVDGNFELFEVIERNEQTKLEIEREASRRLERELSKSRGRYGNLIVHLWLFAAVFLVLAVKYFIF
jgi:hypothetical protein